MSFGVYVHFPFCLQRCPYCDFATVELTDELRQNSAPQEYISLLLNEIQQRGGAVGPRPMTSIYFGGGTPSLMKPEQLGQIVSQLKKSGFSVAPNCEITLEINPGTIDQKTLDQWRALGVNRFSVGSQTFNSDLLKKIGRKHSPDDTRKTLDLLHANGLNFTLDILFALQGQSLEQVLTDIDEALHFDPPHLSAYCLTLPDQHPMNVNRPNDSTQVKMFEIIEERLDRVGFTRYEVSSYAKPGFESRHNWLYWSDQDYWGIGMSAHSFLKIGSWGTRFWNPASLKSYTNMIRNRGAEMSATPFADLPAENVEQLQLHQAVTDFCHTSFRTLQKGLSLDALLTKKFPEHVVQEVSLRIYKLKQLALVEAFENSFRLTKKGCVLADRVFEELTFLNSDFSSEKTAKYRAAPTLT